MKKQLISLLLIAAMVLTLCACGHQHTWVGSRKSLNDRPCFFEALNIRFRFLSCHTKRIGQGTNHSVEIL